MGKKLPKLYTAYSVVNGFRERDNVTFVWYVRNREKGARDYAALIADYATLAIPQPRADLERHVDALFQDPEIEALRDYLQKTHDVEIFVKPVQLPVRRRRQGKLLTPEAPETPGTGVYMLAREKGYDLPVEVWAHYDLRACPLTAEAQLKQRERLPGVRFLQEALGVLGLGEHLDPARVDAAVAELYERRGFVVQQNETESAAEAEKRS